MRDVEGFNAKVALVITRSVGTMACAYVFAAVALISLPAAISSAASDERAAKEFVDTETILDRLDSNTAGGIRDVLDAIHAIGGPVTPPPTPPSQSK